MKNARWYKPTLYANGENITSSQDDISSTHALKIPNPKHIRCLNDQKITKRNQNIHRANNREDFRAKLGQKRVKKSINRGERGHFHHCSLKIPKNSKNPLSSIAHSERNGGRK
jgi:hypothetical protein